LRIIDWDGGRKNGVEPGTGAQLEMNIACHITSIIVSSNHPPKGRISIFYDSIVGEAITDRLVSGAVKQITSPG
jgi:hypothetical protein